MAKAARSDTDEIGSDAEDMIQHLIGQPFDVYRRGELHTVAEWIMTAAALPAAPRALVVQGDSGLTEITDQDRARAAKIANEKLAKAGLRVKGRGDSAELFIAKPKMPAPQKIAAYDNTESIAAADMEARLRRRRAGAAANILTSPAGLGGSTATMGGVAS